jgi:hypothetical protein
MQRDPAEEGLNLYENVESNPVNLTDPTGLASLSEMPEEALKKFMGPLAPTVDAYKAIETYIVDDNRRLKGYERCLLSLFFPGDVLDAARIQVGRPSIAAHGSVVSAFVYNRLQSKVAVTVGPTMYFPNEPSATGDMGWLAHETRHTEQYKEVGGRDNFLKMYLTYCCMPFYGYDNNPFEVDANVYRDAMNKLLVESPELGKALASANPDAEVSRELNAHPEYRSKAKDMIAQSSVASHTLYLFSVVSVPGFPATPVPTGMLRVDLRYPTGSPPTLKTFAVPDPGKLVP